jgi:predicted AAA+ superfamily ATPase
LQGIVDDDQLAAQFILTGSHQLELNSAVSQSLAGRTALLTLLPLCSDELYTESEKISINNVMLNGFMPGRHKDHIENSRFYRAYFQTYVERDVRQLINLKDSKKFEACLKLCAGRIGQLSNYSSLATEVGVSTHTISDWMAVLEASFVIYRLPPYYQNFGKRITKSSKIYFIDTGLAAWLLGIENETQMQRDPLRGNLFENLVVGEVLKSRLNRGLEPNLYFFRDSHGNEVDLIIPSGNTFHAYEIKSGQTWQNSYLKGINTFEKITPNALASKNVVYAGDQGRSTANYRLCPFWKSSEIWP